MQLNFFKYLGVPMTLSELNIDATHFEAMVKHSIKMEYLGYSWISLEVQDIFIILKMCL